MPPEIRICWRISETFPSTSSSVSAKTATPLTSSSRISGYATSAWRPSDVDSARETGRGPSAASTAIALTSPA
jgi:hypothetical protein